MLFEGAGFRRYDTDEPEVSYSASSFLAARIGRQVEKESRDAFQAAFSAASASATTMPTI